MSRFIVFCDGAYSPIRRQGGSGLVVFKDGKSVFEYSMCFKGGSNNTAEICAIILALKCFKAPVQSILIVSDSQYCLGVINKGWKRDKNQKLWQEFDRVYNIAKKYCNNIKFVWTKGHSDSIGNNRADYLATKASQCI